MAKTKSSTTTVHKLSTDRKYKIKDDAKQNGINEIDALFAEKKKKKKDHEIMKKQETPKREKHNGKQIKLSGNRSDMTQLSREEWARDGLGGVFNSEGYTGRKDEQSGFKIYKAHLFNKKGFGQTKDCPFDCDCCFI